ncbi:MAG: STAS domain-containing protein [Nocardioides sp.]
MRERAFEYNYDGGSSTLELYGVIDHGTQPGVREAVDRAYRATPCRLTVDLSGVDLLPAHLLGWLVHLCNTRYPGTLIRLPERRPSTFAPMAATA